MSPRRQNAESGSHEAIGSQKWIVRSIAVVAGALLVFLLSGTMRRIDRMEDKLDDLKDRVVKLETSIPQHGHAQDPAIAELKARVDRIERPRSWERQPSSRR